MSSLREARPSVFDYTLTLTRKRRYLVIGIPEFGLQISSTRLELEGLNAEGLGREVLMAFERIHHSLLELDRRGKPYPEPLSKKPHQSWLSANGAARALGISTSTLRRMVKTGALKARRTPGGHLRFALESITAAAA